jgi:hypothetical protein
MAVVLSRGHHDRRSSVPKRVCDEVRDDTLEHPAIDDRLQLVLDQHLDLVRAVADGCSDQVLDLRAHRDGHGLDRR